MISPAHTHQPSLKHSILLMAFNLDKFEWSPPVTSLAVFTRVKCDVAHHKHLQIIGVNLNYIDSTSWLPPSQSSCTFQQYSHCLNHHIWPPLLPHQNALGISLAISLILVGGSPHQHACWATTLVCIEHCTTMAPLTQVGEKLLHPTMTPQVYHPHLHIDKNPSCHLVWFAWVK